MPLQRKYGVSTVSMFPHSLGARGANRSVDLALDAGYFGIQALPMRGWSYKDTRSWEDYVISFEDAWMFGSFAQAVVRTLGFAGESNPTLLDWMLFGKQFSTYYPRALQVIHHDMPAPFIVEIHGGLWNQAEEYIDFAKNGGLLCFDTRHIKDVWDWEYLPPRLPSESVRMLHINIDQAEIKLLLKGGSSDLTNMLSDIGKRFPAAPAIIEVVPPMKGYKGTVAYLRSIRKAVEFWLDY